MANQRIAFSAINLILVLISGCTLPANRPIPAPTLVVPLSPTFPPSTAAPAVISTQSAVVATPTLAIPSSATFPPSATTIPATIPAGILPGSPSGPYAVVLVEPNDTLNIRSGPGANHAIVGSFASTSTNVQRNGPSTNVDGVLWVEVSNPVGGTGWVNSVYLTDYAPQTNVCDPKAMTLLANLERAVKTSDGPLLASLVSPRHGLDVWAYRSGSPISFDVEHVRWVFQSTYVHNWGDHPASGLTVNGPFHELILPMLADVYANGFEIRCNERGVPGWNISAWPEKYTNYNVYKLNRPGTPGVDLDYRVWLSGMEYINAQPYLTVLINFEWVP